MLDNSGSTIDLDIHEWGSKTRMPPRENGMSDSVVLLACCTILAPLCCNNNAMGRSSKAPVEGVAAWVVTYSRNALENSGVWVKVPLRFDVFFSWRVRLSVQIYAMRTS